MCQQGQTSEKSFTGVVEVVIAIVAPLLAYVSKHVNGIWQDIYVGVQHRGGVNSYFV